MRNVLANKSMPTRNISLAMCREDQCGGGEGMGEESVSSGREIHPFHKKYHTGKLVTDQYMYIRQLTVKPINITAGTSNRCLNICLKIIAASVPTICTQ